MENEEMMVGQEQNAQPINEGAQATEQVAEVASESAQVASSTVVADEESEARPSTIEELKAGMQIKGKVRNVVEFGAFIDIGVGRDGLAHVSTLKRAGIDKSLKVGDEIEVQVRRIDMDKNRISLTIPGAGRGSRASLDDMTVGAVVKGRVVRLVDFGAFVDVGAQTDGLVHVSQMQGSFVNHPSEVVKVGDELDVRILEVDEDRRRISLTMKLEEEPVVMEEPRRQPARPRQDGPGEARERRPRRRPRRDPVTASFTTEGSDGSVPTAFEFAWQKALSERSGDQD